MKNDFDVIIVGAGIVGLAFALSLAQETRLSVGIIEASNNLPTWQEAEYQTRVSAITLSSVRFFQKLEIWDTLKQKRVSPFEAIQVGDFNNQGNIRFNSTEIAAAQLGYIIENDLLQLTLVEALNHFPQVKFFRGCQLASLMQNALVDEVGNAYSGKLLIAADGAHSWLREAAGFVCHKKLYDQQAIVATVKTALPHQKIARQLFLSDGPLAFLPLSSPDVSSIVWSLPTVDAQKYLSLPAVKFAELLAEKFLHQLGEVTLLSERFSFPLLQQKVDQYAIGCVALIGDAAHTVHPLAGQGVNMGLGDAAVLSDLIVAAELGGKNFANTSLLKRYQRARKADNLLLQQGIECLRTCFAVSDVKISGMRARALNVIDQQIWLKNIFTRFASL